MKKYLSLLLILLLSITFNVKADMGPPSIARFELVVSNKNGATCYDQKDGKFVATNKKIDYNKIVYLDYNYDGDYYSISLKDEEINDNCLVNIHDLSLKDSSFSQNNQSVEKITPKYAIVFAGGGLNLRKGPSTMYSKVTLIPEKTILKLTHKAGDLWYYTEYNGKSGWVSADYVAYDEDYILYEFENVNIYSDKKLTKKIGTIPKLTDISNYVTFGEYSDDAGHYVNYNGIKGYTQRLHHKLIDKITIDKEVNLYDKDNKVIKKIKPGIYECFIGEYPIGDGYGTDSVFLTSENGIIKLEQLYAKENEEKNYYELAYKSTTLKKDKGYIGEGLFGEKIVKIDRSNVEDDNTSTPDPNNLIDVNDGKTNEVKEELKKQDKMNNETIIIIVLAAVVLALTITVIILLVNKKKNKVVIEEKNDSIANNKEEVKEENEKQFEEHNEEQNNLENEHEE